MTCKKTATLLISCPDAPGHVARFANFIFANGGNIIHADQHTDFEAGLFLTRLEWELGSSFQIPRSEIGTVFASQVAPPGARWRLAFSDIRKKLAIWVSRQNHCLYDLLLRQQAGELDAEVAVVMANHPDVGAVAKQMGVPFHCIPVTKETKNAAEKEQQSLLSCYGIDLVVLAKYMQILSADFLAEAPTVINIHHSFLPAFPGAQPYHRAYDRGVKVIGASAHYVTADLDEGPIIAQDVVRVNHRDTVEDMIREGRDIERVVLARAVRLHLQDRVLVYGNRTVVFD
jgi:formyltetrahydrofolate deformylase